jgi:hypothetical protein
MNAHPGYNDFIRAVHAAFHPISLLDVRTFPHLSRVIAIVEDSNLVAAIGRRGETVRRVSQTLSLDVEVMTLKEFNIKSRDAPNVLAKVDGLDKDSGTALAKNGILDLDDLCTMDPKVVAQITGLPLTDASAVVDAASDATN